MLLKLKKMKEKKKEKQKKRRLRLSLVHLTVYKHVYYSIAAPYEYTTDVLLCWVRAVAMQELSLKHVRVIL